MDICEYTYSWCKHRVLMTLKDVSEGFSVGDRDITCNVCMCLAQHPSMALHPSTWRAIRNPSSAVISFHLWVNEWAQYLACATPFSGSSKWFLITSTPRPTSASPASWQRKKASETWPGEPNRATATQNLVSRCAFTNPVTPALDAMA